ncbi:MAG: Mu transposase C-terminal domain-containing protein [Treponema sp.]|jgi:putative transposase|nr:Mu transposase C-terminal domain-containing protein [Treponema sp.]
MGVTQYGKFQSTYNDNGSSEKSAVADYVIEQLQQYAMRFCDESDLYRTDAGDFVIEDDEGNVLDVVQSRAAWQKQHRRIFAAVKNAKTKPIERFFSTLEQLLQDMILPGYVRELNATAAEDEEAQRRLDWQKRNRYILTGADFSQKVLQALDRYAHRVHSSLKRSPQEALQYAIKKEGWQYQFVDPEALHYLFLERAYATVRGDRVTLLGRQFIGPSLTPEMVAEGRGNLVGFNRKKIELRYDPDDLDAGAWAINPRNGQGIFLKPVERIPMLDDAAASAAIEAKRKNMKAVRDAYKSLTADAQVLFDFEKFRELEDSKAVAEASFLESPPSGALLPAPPKSNPLPAPPTGDNFQAQVAAMISAEPYIRERSKRVYLSEYDRYKALLDAMSRNETIATEDLAFKSRYEETMSDEQFIYFADYIKQKKQPL